MEERGKRRKVSEEITGRKNVARKLQAKRGGEEKRERERKV